MVLTKTNAHLSMGNDGGNRVGGVQKNGIEPVDHWAFLEEIEAPMWVDLNLEAKSINKDNDDEWFHISHPFHQCASRQLISAFSHSGEGSANSDVDLQGPSSPKLPSSVSRSRGKHYRSRKWERNKSGVSLNKRHPVKILSGKTSWVDSGSSQEIKPKSSCRSLKETVSSKTSLVCESSSTGTAGPNYYKPIFSFGDSKSRSSYIAIKAGESNSTSTITSETSQQQQQKFLEVSSQTVGVTSELLSALKISLRKSCVTRQASRVEINDGRQSKGRKSSSSKSSVGSSSNPAHDVKNMTLAAIRNKDSTPDSRNVARMSRATKNNVKVSNVSSESTVQVQNVTSNSRWGGKTIVAKPTHQQAAKSKVLCRTKSSVTRVNGQGPLTAAPKAMDKVGSIRFKRLEGGGKENVVGRMDVSQKSGGRDIVAGGMVLGQKATKRTVPQKGDRAGLVGSKGKISDRGEGKNPSNATQKVYLR